MSSIGEAKAAIIHPHDIAIIRQPMKPLAELRNMGFSKHIVVMDDTPYPQRLAVSPLDIFNLTVRNFMIQYGGHAAIFARSDTGLALRNIGRLYESVSSRNAISKNVRLNSIADVFGGRIAIVDKEWLGFKSKRLVLIDRHSDDNG